MHDDKCISSSMNDNSRSNSIKYTNNTKIVMQQQMLGFCNIEFQEQENLSKDSTFILNNDTKTLVERDMVEKQLGITCL